MPRLSQIRDSKYLKKDDVGGGIQATIFKFEEANVAMENQAEEMKWLVYFRDLEKPLVLNSTNAQAIAEIFGIDELNDSIGKKVVLYTDPGVQFAGKRVGGIRIRAAKAAKAAASAKGTKNPAPEPDDDDDEEETGGDPKDNWDNDAPFSPEPK